MYRPRLIPVLLLKDNALYKSIGFKRHKYIGDPLNAVRLFNDLSADELCFLDIEASLQRRMPNFELIKRIGEEANMPFSVGGGIASLESIQKILAAGAEKVVINSAAVMQENFIAQAAQEFGSSTVSVCIDARKAWYGGAVRASFLSGTKLSPHTPQALAQAMELQGAGELIVQSINKDGSMSGYDLPLIESVSRMVRIPVVALGGAGSVEDVQSCYQATAVNGLGAGSLFVYQSKMRGVLINYPPIIL